MHSESPLTAAEKAFWAAVAPPPRLTVSEWAERFRHLSPEASAEPGLWRNSRAPHLTEPMDCLGPHHPAERVVCKFSSQVGKTEMTLNTIGFVADLDPGPTLSVQPNVSPMGETFSKDRVAPMFRDSPTLAMKIGPSKSRASSSTILHKTFPGGHLTIVGANSVAGLAARPIRYLLLDEIDRFEPSKEGDPILLARKRQQTFAARRSAKELIVSSPTFGDLGICAEYDRCTQQFEWHLTCRHCGETQLPRLKHFNCTDNDPESLRYVCEHCGGEHAAELEGVVKASGRWVRVKDGPPTAVGFHMNQWASPFASWAGTWREWADAEDDPARKQVVTNTAFAEPWSGEGEQADPMRLLTRLEKWGEVLPPQVELITLGADVQADRIEVEVVGWGANQESWSLAYEVLPGEPTNEEGWEALLELYRTPWRRPDGTVLKATTMAVDSGAFTTHVYLFVKRSKERGIVPVKGAAGMFRDPLNGDRAQRRRRIAKRMRDGHPPEILGVDSIKRTVYMHLNAAPGRPGYCHFPTGRSEEYFLQLTGERLVVVSHKSRRPERRWVPIHPNVEALDCRAYAYAALLLTDKDLRRKPERALPDATPAVVQDPVAPKPKRRQKPQSSWVNYDRGSWLRR